MRIIDALRRSNRPLSLKDLAEMSQIPASNCHRYLVSLKRVGFVAQDPHSSQYDLGPSLLRAGLVALSRLDPITVGNDALLEVVNRTEQSGLLGIWTDRGAVIVRWLSGRDMIRTNLWVGDNLPLLRSATGQAFLAYLPSGQTKDVVAREITKSDEDPAAIVARVHRSGFADVAERHIPGLSAIAAPILGASGEAEAVIGLVGAIGGFTDVHKAQLLAVTAHASGLLGFCSIGDARGS